MISLKDVKSDVIRLHDLILPYNPDSKKCMSLLIAYLMISFEVAGTQSWESGEKAIRETINFSDESIYRIAEMVFENLHDGPFWTITPEFIIDLGNAYLWLLTKRFFN